ncbi:MAG: AAA family ATPase [Lentimicrobiaceae bacterium]|jgi:predicted AAA+ superfamily ATPase|nr:AAA family ATPase [Lentimicrobiaceae bacterium]
MERKLMSSLIQWKDSKGRKPLLLEGARQVGKTWLLKEFGKRYFKNVAYVNFQNPSAEITELFDGSIEPHRIVGMLELYLDMKISATDTLLFFDEVQEVPRALTSLKYFYEDAPEYHIVTAGSLLGVFLHKGTSFPVGKIDTLRLEPLDFEEFIWANGREKMLDYIKEHPFENKFKEVFYDLFKYYLFIGGMPAVVADWIETHDFDNVKINQEKILNNYRNDFSKHADHTSAIRIRQVFESLPAQFAKKNDKFMYGVVKEGARAREYELAIEWLLDAGIVRRVNNVKVGDKIPLKAYAESSAFKLYFVDIGLFRCLADIPSDVIQNKDAVFDEFNGLLAEQFVLQELTRYNIFFWTSEKISEVDFVIQYGANVVPIEVKSGTNVKAKSLKQFRDKYSPKISVRFSLKDTRLDDDLLNISLYYSPIFDMLVAYAPKNV